MYLRLCVCLSVRVCACVSVCLSFSRAPRGSFLVGLTVYVPNARPWLQAAYDCLYTLLDACPDRIVFSTFLQHVLKGLSDDSDIQVRLFTAAAAAPAAPAAAPAAVAAPAAAVVVVVPSSSSSPSFLSWRCCRCCSPLLRSHSLVRQTEHTSPPPLLFIIFCACCCPSLGLLGMVQILCNLILMKAQKRVPASVTAKLDTIAEALGQVLTSKVCVHLVARREREGRGQQLVDTNTHTHCARLVSLIVGTAAWKQVCQARGGQAG